MCGWQFRLMTRPAPRPILAAPACSRHTPSIFPRTGGRPKYRQNSGHYGVFASRQSGELRHTLWPITEQPQPTQTQIRLTAWLSAHAWQIRCSPDHPMLRPFTPHTHSFRPVRHAWRVITDPYDKMSMCDAARSLIGVLSPGSRHAPVDHGHTHTGLAISGQKGETDMLPLFVWRR